MGSCFKIGDRVRKIVGYPFVGTVCAVYDNETKCVVKHKDGWEHIFSDKQLSYDHPEYQYTDLLKDVMENGIRREGRNGVTYGVFGRQIRFDLSKGFPLLTTKKLHTKSIFGEMLWFISGETNIKPLQDQGITIWNEWADNEGNLGPVYGQQWRSWRDDTVYVNPNDEDDVYGGVASTIDQFANVIEQIKQDPNSRRHIITAWNPSDIPHMALPPCHCLFQFFVENGKLSCQLYQRSADLFLGVPFNIASYALLVHLVARECNLEVGDFVHTFGDLHLYANHIEQAAEQITRQPLPFPSLYITGDKDIYNVTLDDIKLVDYQSHPHIKAEVSK